MRCSRRGVRRKRWPPPGRRWRKARIRPAPTPTWASPCWTLGRLGEAERVLRRALELDPRHVNARQHLAETLRRQKRYEAAVVAYRKVLKRDRRFAAAHAGLGDALFHQRRYDEAHTHLREALSLEPDSPVAAALHGILGQTLRRLGRIEERRNNSGAPWR